MFRLNGPSSRSPKRSAARRARRLASGSVGARVDALESRVLFAQTTPPDNFFGTDTQAATPNVADFNALPILDNTSAATVAAELATIQGQNKPLAVRVTQSLTNPASIAIFNSFPVDYVFADFFDAAATLRTRALANQVLASTQSSGAVLGNFNDYPNAGIDPTRPGSTPAAAPRFVNRPTDADYAAGRGQVGASLSNQMANEALWPGSADFRNPAAGNSGAPNIRSATFTLPIQRFTLSELGLRGLAGAPAGAAAFAQAGRPNATTDLHIPSVTRFNNFGNSSLDSDGNAANGYAFVSNAATPSNGQLLSRGDFQAMMLHYRMRGAASVNLQHNGGEGGSVVGYSLAQSQSDVRTGWMASGVANDIAERANYALANLTNTIGDDAADPESGDTAPRSTELSGAVWSGIYDRAGSVDPISGNRQLTILLSNLGNVQRTIDLPNDIGGFGTYQPPTDAMDADFDSYAIQAGSHRLLNFELKLSERGQTEWVFTGDSFIGLDNNRNGIGLGTQAVVADPNAEVPVLTVSNVSQAEGNAGTTAFNFTLTRIGGNQAIDSTVSFSTAADTATVNVDYAPTTGSVTFGAGETEKTVTVLINGDGDFEADERFTLDFANPTNLLVAGAQGVGTILNDDVALPSLSIGDAAVTEGGAGTTATATVNVTLSAASAETVTVNYATVDGQATDADADYEPVSGTLTFLPGETSKNIGVTVNGDAKFEPDEALAVSLSSPANATVADGTGAVTVTNDDAAPTIRINDVARAEGTGGGGGTTPFDFTVSLSNPTSTPFVLSYATADGAATTADNDYVGGLGFVSFAPGETSKTLTVEVNADGKVEANEDFAVALLSTTPGGAAVAGEKVTGIGTILDDDAPTLSVSDVALAEGDAGQRAFKFTLTRAGGDLGAVSTVGYETAPGTATAGTDYQSAAGTVTFQAGQTSRTVTVFVNGDLDFEPNESFLLNLSDPSNLLVPDAQATATILADDLPPSSIFSVNDVSRTEGNSGTKDFAFTVTRSGDLSSAASVVYNTTALTASHSTDYNGKSNTTLSFAPGQATRTVSIQVKGDTRYEQDEAFLLKLSSPSAGTVLGDASGNATIINDDAPPAFSVADVSVSEGNSGTKTLTFTVKLSKASERAAIANYATANGSASSGSDYTAKSGTLVFAPGQTSKTVSITVKGDKSKESSEVFYLNLFGADAATIGDGQGKGTIKNDD